MTFLDGLGSLPQLSSYSKDALAKLRVEAVERLQTLAPLSEGPDDDVIHTNASQVQLGSFCIPRGPRDIDPNLFSFQAPTTKDNVHRVVRATQLRKPILLEGSPGVGKTSLVSALANICGYQLCRINLSDQTDLIDLFGSDLPVEGGSPGQFAWKDAEFLRALQEGHWVLLDEMNLAPQAVLEGLNALLDHRGTVYIPELGRSFTRHPSFRIFAAQNPLYQGGGRKGLPKSFLNRFTKVYVQELSSEDVLLVCQSLFPTIPQVWIHGMVAYITRLQEEVIVKRSFGREGSPWEFNLRDVIRWASQIQTTEGKLVHPARFISILFLQRFRTIEDRILALRIFTDLFNDLDFDLPEYPRITISPVSVKIGREVISRSGRLFDRRPGTVLQCQLAALEALTACLANGWLAILNGPRGCGKSSLVRTIANLAGSSLHEISINNATDASDILGSFEEIDPRVRAQKLLDDVSEYLEGITTSCNGSKLLASQRVYCSLEALRSSLSAGKPHADIWTIARQVRDTFAMDSSMDSPQKEKIVFSLDGLLADHDGLGRFEWIDGPLVRALKDGSWILLDGANLCNPSVLDRLNSLCENDGRLTLNERGAVNGEVEIIKPHPNFRLFMCVDSQLGELSRAMRNRGVEITILHSDKEEDRKRILDYHSLPTCFGEWSVTSAELPLQFESVRRALRIGNAEGNQNSMIPPGTLYGEDATLSDVLPWIPFLQPSTDLAGRLQSFSLFATHSVTPTNIALVLRLLGHAHQAFPQLAAVRTTLDQLLSSHALSLTRNTRASLSTLHGVPLDVLLAQVGRL
jgi:midasin